MPAQVFRALRLSLARRIQGQQRAVSQDELMKTRSYVDQLRTNESGNMAKLAPGKWDANAPMEWFCHVKAAGTGGFWPWAMTPLVCLVASLLGKFLYENVHGQDQYDGQIADMQKDHKMSLHRVCL